MESMRSSPGLGHLIWLVIVTSFLLLSACSGGEKPSEGADTSTLIFSLAIHDNRTVDHLPAAALIDCPGEGLVTMEAHLYDQDRALVKSSERWPCSDGQGTIDNIPAGRILTLVAMGRDADGGITLRGSKSGLYIVPGGTSDAGIVDCYRFVPGLTAPQEGVELEAAAVSLSWNAVTNAAGYGVLIYESGDMSDPVVHATTIEPSYSPPGLLDSHTYHWQVYARDEMGNHGGGSQALSFDTIAIPHLAVGDLMGAGGAAGDSTYTLHHAVGEPLTGASAAGGNALASGFLHVVQTYEP